MPEDESPARVVVGVDYGGRRIGIAVSESGVIASPHSVIRNEGDVVQQLARIGAEVDAALYVVGIPRRSHRDLGEEKYERFADALRQRTCRPVVLWNESLSTVEASERLRASGHTRREAQEKIDMHAAVVILQSYLDSSARRKP